MKKAREREDEGRQESIGEKTQSTYRIWNIGIELQRTG